MKTAQIFLWLAGSLLVIAVLSVDFNTLPHWWAGRVFLSSDDLLTSATVTEPLPVSVDASTWDFFGNDLSVELNSDEYSLVMHPLDSFSQRHATLVYGCVQFAQAGLYHVRFEVCRNDSASFRFYGDAESESYNHIFDVDGSSYDVWRRVTFEHEPAEIQRHLEILRQVESDSEGIPYLEWLPTQFVSGEEAVYLCNQAVYRLRGHASMQGGYQCFDGQKFTELPAPPIQLGSPAMCIHDNQWILAGGEDASAGYGVDQPVFAMDLKSHQWTELPVLPENITSVSAIGVWKGALSVLSMPYDSATDQYGDETIYSLVDDAWIATDRLPYDTGVGDAFFTDHGLLSVASPAVGKFRTVKLYRDGEMRTVAIAKPSWLAPVSPCAGLLFQMLDDNLYELSVQRMTAVD